MPPKAYSLNTLRASAADDRWQRSLNFIHRLLTEGRLEEAKKAFRAMAQACEEFAGSIELLQRQGEEQDQQDLEDEGFDIADVVEDMRRAIRQGRKLEAKEYAMTAARLSKRLASMLQSEVTRVALANEQIRHGQHEIRRGNPQPEPDMAFGSSS
eukprot:g15098.t1